ncbi:MAG: MFS transporter [Pseudomonadales bacterium]|nr:MFS transporter [Pseudomonadales bacterium]
MAKAVTGGELANRDDESPLSFKTKFSFGVGAIAELIALTSVGSFAMFYYNQVLGLSATLAGLAITMGLVLDGVTDPLMGSISDRTRSRLGRRHPYMFVAPIPVGISIFAVFNPPEMLPAVWLFAWFSGFVILLRFCMTLYHVPHLALGGELSSSYTERTRVMSYNNFCSWIGGAGTTWIAYTFFFHATPEFARGLLNPDAYAPFSVVASITAVFVLFASAWFTRDQIPRLPKPPSNLPRYSPFEFFRDMGKAFSNMNYVWLLVAFFFLSLMLGLRSGLGIYVNTFYWELTSEQIRLFVIGSACGYFTGFFASTGLHGQFDKKRVIVVTALSLSVIPAMPIVLRMMGYFPENHTEALVPALIAFAALSSAAGSILNISVMSALADIADENEVRYGLRQEGVLYSTRTLFSKIDNAIGHFFAGITLDLIGFPARGRSGEVPDDVLWHLGLIDSPLAIIPGVIAAFFYGKYAIDRRVYEANRSRLVALRVERLRD